MRHCGHPTANWPYYTVDLEGRMVLASEGRGFRTLAEAQAEVERRATFNNTGRTMEDL